MFTGCLVGIGSDSPKRDPTDSKEKTVNSHTTFINTLLFRFHWHPLKYVQCVQHLPCDTRLLARTTEIAWGVMYATVPLKVKKENLLPALKRGICTMLFFFICKFKDNIHKWLFLHALRSIKNHYIYFISDTYSAGVMLSCAALNLTIHFL